MTPVLLDLSAPGRTRPAGLPLDGVQRVLGSRATRPAVAGVLATVVLVLAMGRSAVPVGMSLPVSFWGVLSPARSGGGLPAALVVVALAVLLAAWWRLLALASRGLLAVRTTSWVVGLWLAPVLLGPPLLSLDAYAYLAQGEMAARGLDPYAAGPVALGGDPVLHWVDPVWRASPTPYGPISLVALRAVALLGHGLTGDVLLLRLLALVGVAVAVAGALLLCPVRQRPLVLVATAANPITVVHLVGGVHLDALLAGLVTLTLLALRGGRLRSSLVLAGVAVACKVTVLPLFILVALVVARRRPRRTWPLEVLAALAAPLALSALAVERPWGFLAALVVPGAQAPWYAPGTVVGGALHLAAVGLQLPVPESVTALAGRALVLATGAGLVLRALLLTWRDAEVVDDRRLLARAGHVLLVVALVQPALYGWYLSPALFVVAATGRPQARTLLVALSSGLLFTSLPPMYNSSRPLLYLAAAVALTVLAANLPRAWWATVARAWQRSPALARPWAGLSAVPGAAAALVARVRTVREAPADAPPAPPVLVPVPSRSLPRVRRGLRVVEIALVPALVLAAATPWAEAVPAPPPTAEAVQDADLPALARVTHAVTAAYPDAGVVQVRRGPGTTASTEAAQLFDVDLVLPEHEVCRVRVVLDGRRRPAVADPAAPTALSGRPYRCPSPQAPVRPSPRSSAAASG